VDKLTNSTSLPTFPRLGVERLCEESSGRLSLERVISCKSATVIHRIELMVSGDMSSLANPDSVEESESFPR
jgi:hypothetical protein